MGSVIISGLLFNPVIPLYLEKELWVVYDILFSIDAYRIKKLTRW